LKRQTLPAGVTTPTGRAHSPFRDQDDSTEDGAVVHLAMSVGGAVGWEHVVDDRRQVAPCGRA
jgi:hypothetical protein